MEDMHYHITNTVNKEMYTELMLSSTEYRILSHRDIYIYIFILSYVS